MNLRTRIVAAGTAAAMVSIFGLAGTAASAAPSAPPSTVARAHAVGPNAAGQQAVGRQRTAALPVTGLLPGGRKFTGQLSRMAVSVANGVPMLSGLLTGTGLPAAGAPFTTAITSAQATCQILNLNIQPIHLDLLGLVVDLDAVHLAVNAVQGPGKLLGNLLCSLANGANPGAVPTQMIAPLLSQVIPMLRLGSVMQRGAGLPVTGQLPGGRKFTGQISRMAVSVVNGVPMLSGLLNGTGLPAAGAPFTTAISSAQAACQVLNLNVQPIHLDLLGLVVDLDAVHLAINAVPGAGNLLGNLLCALANAANPGPVPTQIIAPLLSQVIPMLRLGPVTPLR